MTDGISAADTLKLLADMARFHGAAAENLKAGVVDEPRARSELIALHIAIGTLAGTFLGGETNAQHLHERRLELTKIRAAHLYEEARDSDRAVIQFASLGLKSLLLANGGALVAMLTFLGNYDNVPEAKTTLWVAFSLFVAGLVLSLAALIFSYLSQGSTTFVTTSNADAIFFHEYRGQDGLKDESFAEAQRHHGIGTGLRITAIAAAVLSAVAFAVGSGCGIAALMSVPA